MSRIRRWPGFNFVSRYEKNNILTPHLSIAELSLDCSGSYANLMKRMMHQDIIPAVAGQNLLPGLMYALVHDHEKHPSRLNTSFQVGPEDAIHSETTGWC